MISRRTIFVLLMAFLMGASALADSTDKRTASCTNFSDVGFKDRSEATAFLDKLKTANTPDELAALVTYPLRVNSGNFKKSLKRLIILNEVTFREKFDDIFTPKILEALHKQDPNGIFCNSQGMAVGNGLVWVGTKKGRVGIYTVNQL